MAKDGIMAFRTVINPAYKYLCDFIRQLPERFAQEGECLYKGRNEIRLFEAGGLRLNVKQYRIPILLNRLVYGFWRPSKAERAYRYALRLQALGVNTPSPVAYLEEKRSGILRYSYFISLQVPYSRRFYEFGTEPLPGKEEIVRDFGIFTARLHNAGIYHKDYSPGNILFDVKEGKAEFCLVDINRMEFGPVGMDKGCSNFARLWGKEPFFRLIAQEYAWERHFDPEECTARILKYRRKFWTRYLRRKPAKFELDL